MAISAGLVRTLREKTGLPMMECKKALEETGGDEAAAIEVLRKKGLAQVSKRAGRATSEGRVTCIVDSGKSRAAIVEVLCETEPVSNNEDFLKLVDSAAKATVQLESPTTDLVLEQADPNEPTQKVVDRLNDVVNRIRENIKIGRVGVSTGEFGYYLHHDGKKGVLIEFTGACPDQLKSDVCMHVVAMRPPYARREDVPGALVDKERELAKEQVQGKPENIVDKIVTGKINKWLSEIVLLEQPFVKDDKKSVGQVLREASPDLSVRKMLRIEIGEGAEE